MKRRSWVSIAATSLVAVFLSALSLVYAEVVSAQGNADPVLVGAGDIGNCSSRGDQATATLMDGIDGTVFTAGDNAYPDGTASDFTRCYEPSWGRHKGRTMPAAGNHEYETPSASGHFGYFGAAAGDPDEGYYSYDRGEWHMIVLNSNCVDVPGGCATGSPQQEWLEADLAANPNTCTLAYFHHPRFSSGQHGNSVSVSAFWTTLYDAGVDVILNGHDHVYERFAPQNPGGQADPEYGIRQFVVGTGGAAFTAFKSIKPNSQARIASTNGVLKMTLHPESYDWEFVTAPAGAIADSGTAGCSTTPPPSPSDTTAPAVQPPQQVLPGGSTLGTSAVPTRFDWSATDEESGVASYELQQSIDGGAFKNVALSSTTSTSKTLQLQPGRAYQFRVRAVDGAGNVSDWAAGPAFTVELQQEVNDAALVYAGNWTQQALASASGGGVRYSGAADNAAQFTFTGRNVAWVTTKGPNRGRATVSIDGVVVSTVDLYASATQYRKVVFSHSGLDPEVSHTIAVQVLGKKKPAATDTRVDVDAFVVLR